MTARRIVGPFLIFVGLLICLTICFFKSPGEPRLFFLGTDNQGKVCLFALTNYSRIPVDIYYRVEIKERDSWNPHPNIMRCRWSPVDPVDDEYDGIHFGQGIVFKVDNPQTNRIWRIQVVTAAHMQGGAISRLRGRWAATLYKRDHPAVAEWLQPKPQGLILDGPDILPAVAPKNSM